MIARELQPNARTFGRLEWHSKTIGILHSGLMQCGLSAYICVCASVCERVSVSLCVEASMYTSMHALSRAQVMDTLSELGSQVGSVRAVAPLPLQGHCYFEITLKRYGRADGQVWCLQESEMCGERNDIFQKIPWPQKMPRHIACIQMKSPWFAEFVPPFVL